MSTFKSILSDNFAGILVAFCTSLLKILYLYKKDKHYRFFAMRIFLPDNFLHLQLKMTLGVCKEIAGLDKICATVAMKILCMNKPAIQFLSLINKNDIENSQGSNKFIFKNSSTLLRIGWKLMPTSME